MQLAVFSTLAHEIGHHQNNTSNKLFPISGTEEQYVSYRANLEAEATFNSFLIFSNLKNTVDKFVPNWSHVGYLSGIELPKLYDRWILAKQVSASSTRWPLKFPTQPTRCWTHQKILMAITALRIAMPISAITASNGSASRTFRITRHPCPPQKRQRIRDISLQLHHRHGRICPTATPRHRDHALYETIRGHLPIGTSDEMAAHITLQAKAGRVRDAEHVDVVMVHEGRVFVMSKTPGFRAHVDLSEMPPPISETMQRSESLDAERAQQREQWMAQEQQLSQSRSLSRSL